VAGERQTYANDPNQSFGQLISCKHRRRNPLTRTGPPKCTLDQPVGTDEQGERDFEAEHFGGS
jgi:hypothetical protein